MTIDLSTVKAGDEVEFRCGGRAVITKVKTNPLEYDGFYFIKLNSVYYMYWKSGAYYNGLNLFDIIKVTPKAFDWANAKPGMAFTELSTGYVLYMVDDYTNAYGFAKRSVVLDKITASVNLKRAPEYDIKIDKNG